MEQQKYIEVELLLKKVKEKYKVGAYTTNDYVMLSEAISESGAGYISTATLKRLFGYVNDRHKPTITTLDILAKYIGYNCYEEFYKAMLDESTVASAFLSDNQIWSKNLTAGDIVEIGWAPNRCVQLTYQGDNWYEVVDSSNAKLMPGDRFMVAIFMLGEPLYLNMVYRNDSELGCYVAGLNGGLITLSKV